MQVQETIIVKGVGLPEYPIGETSIEQVIEGFGKDYRESEVKGRNMIELKYEALGLVFYHKIGDESKTLSGIRFLAPFKGRTQEGIVLNESKLSDVEDLYGAESLTIGSTGTKFSIIEGEYPGINYIARIDIDLATGRFPSREFQLSRIVEEIYITNYKGYKEIIIDSDDMEIEMEMDY